MSDLLIDTFLPKATAFRQVSVCKCEAATCRPCVVVGHQPDASVVWTSCCDWSPPPHPPFHLYLAAQAPAGPVNGKAAAAAASAGQGDVDGEEGAAGGAEWLDDVVTGAEAAEAALPSANPASGPHPHAPGARADAPNLSGATRPKGGGVPALPAARRAALRGAAGRRYRGSVGEEEGEVMAALLGGEHIFKLRVVE